ncbi:MAG TPA: NRDE family protein [Candidatus Dormibacteraeota bacterium]
MCTILLAWRCSPETPIILAANRDELITRASAPPGVLSTSPLVMGGTDLVAGGTWLAVAADGTVCAVTNRHPADGKPKRPDPTRRSRGEIPLALLGGVGPRDVPARLAVLGPGRYNPVNVAWVSAERALVAEVDDTGPVHVIDLEPGVHVLTTGDLDDRALPKVAMLRTGMDSALAAGGGSGELLLRMRGLLASHTSPTDRPVDAACIHGDVYGTVSASSVVAGHRGVTYEHAPGRPCVTPFARVVAPD